MFVSISLPPHRDLQQSCTADKAWCNWLFSFSYPVWVQKYMDWPTQSSTSTFNLQLGLQRETTQQINILEKHQLIIAPLHKCFLLSALIFKFVLPKVPCLTYPKIWQIYARQLFWQFWCFRHRTSGNTTQILTKLNNRYFCNISIIKRSQNCTKIIRKRSFEDIYIEVGSIPIEMHI